MTIFGWGVFKGMMVTLKNFLTSYFRKPDEGGIFTVQYPEEREKAIENFRNFPFLVYDGSPEKIRCVACGICERECPPKCIHIEMEIDVAGKPTRKPAVFDIDYGLCMNCGMCEEVCPFDSIFMDHAFEVTAPERNEGLVRNKKELSKSNEYFQKVRPTLASSIDQKRKAAEEKKKAAAAPQGVGGQAQPPQGQEPK
ncbi:MAG: 4Fe-4S binding protein [Candidatus Omnitrophota bacterium]